MSATRRKRTAKRATRATRKKPAASRSGAAGAHSALHSFHVRNLETYHGVVQDLGKAQERLGKSHEQASRDWLSAMSELQRDLTERCSEAYRGLAEGINQSWGPSAAKDRVQEAWRAYLETLEKHSSLSDVAGKTEQA